MLGEELQFQERLWGVIRKSKAPLNMHDDLHQIALVHVLEIESKEPGQTVSWYLDSCKRHLGDYLKKGRSVDAPKRRHLACAPPETDEDSNGWTPEGFIAKECVLAAVSAADLVSHLSARL